MYGERPVPDGTLTSDSDQNQPSRPAATVGAGSQPPRRDRPRDRNRDRPRGSGEHDRTRDARDQDWERESVQRDDRDYDRDRHYGRRGSGEEEEVSRPWSRNGYYEREPPDFYHSRPPPRDPYYGYGADYRPMASQYDYRDRGYPPFRPHPQEYVDPNYSMMNTSFQSRGYPSLPPQVSSASKQQTKAYLEEFRVRDPKRYKEWYVKYREHLANPTRIPMPAIPGYPPPPTPYMPGPSSQQHLDRRTPVMPRQRYESEPERPVILSGRNSENDGSIFNPPESEFESMIHDDTGYGRGPPFEHVTETSPQRMTPQKFLSPHSIGLVTPLGQLLKLDGNTVTVEITSIRTLLKDLPEAQELERFPGPLLKGKTYKKDVIKFCEKKIKFIEKNEVIVDRANLILLWELLILLIRQNGAVVGSDIAELLLKKKVDAENEEEVEMEENHVEVTNNGALNISSNDVKATQKFCDLLLFGHKSGALEYAMSNNLWGHALFLASKMGERDYGQVMARFANGLGFNHPLQTLYQIMSGRQPSSVTACGDELFGDWKPHLAMMISNSEARPDIACKAFITLGDTLRNKSQIYGSQFCYLMSQTLFSEDSKLGPLLGLAPDETNVLEATQMTEIYEYATSLAETNFNAGISFLHKKFNYTKALVDYGFTFEAYSYCEVIAKQLKHVDQKAETFENLRWSLLQVAERLQYCDEAVNRGGQEWIAELRASLNETIASQSTSRRESLTSTQPETPADGEASSTAPSIYNNYQPSQPVNFQNTGYEDTTAQPPSINPYYIPTPTYGDQNQGQSQAQGGWEGLSTGQGLDSIGTGGNSAYEQNQNSNIPASDQLDYQQQDPYYNQNPASQKPYEQENVPTLNNNYYSSPINMQNGYASQPSQLSNGPTSLGMPQSDTINYNQPIKKKTVRFEDEEEVDESPKSNETPEPSVTGAGKSSLRMMNRGRSSNVPTPIPLLSRSLLKTSIPKPDSFDSDDPAVDETPPETTDDDEYDCPAPVVPKNTVQFKSTFPIDAPFGASPKRPTTLKTSSVSTVIGRTFPIDKKCCDSREPCTEHDGSRVTAVSTVTGYPNPTSPLPSSSALLLSSPSHRAGPNVNSQSRVKNENYENQYSHTQPPPQPYQQPQKPQSTPAEIPKKAPEPPKPAKSSPKKEPSKASSGGSGLFSGIFSKLSLKPKNQMILPDDKEPTIVWDAAKGQWVNTKGDEDDDGRPKGPPPKDSDLNPNKTGPQINNNIPQPPQASSAPPLSFGNQNQSTWNQQPEQTQAPPSFNGNPQFQSQGQALGQPQSLGQPQVQGQPNWNAPQGQPQMPQQPAPAQPQLATPGQPSAFASNNKYGLPKGRLLRGGYVDVLNPGGTPAGSKLPPPMNIGNGGMMPPMFIPAPAPMNPSGDSGSFSFLTQPSQDPGQGQQQQQDEYDGIR